jgi:nicotinamidase-related amidase
MAKNDTLRYGPPGQNSIHICVDMQRMFAEDTEWKMPWLERVLPSIVEISAAHSERTIFTRFIPAQKAGHGVGIWRRYYERWATMTIDELGPDMIDVVPDLARFIPPARTFDKPCIRLGRARIFTTSCEARMLTPLSSPAARPTSAYLRRC